MPETEEQLLYQSVIVGYEKGMKFLQDGEFDQAGSAFDGAAEAARELDDGHGLFVPRTDGRWAYRQDEISQYYALAAYRDGVLFAEETTAAGHEQRVMEKFCGALRCPGSTELLQEMAVKDPIPMKGVGPVALEHRSL